MTDVSLKESRVKAIQAAIICEPVLLLTTQVIRNSYVTVAPRNCIPMGQEV